MKYSNYLLRMARVFNFILGIFKLRLIKVSRIEEFDLFSSFYWNDPFLRLFKNPVEVSKLVKKSKSQIRQDLFVISELNFKKNGYFVEIGAQNGIDGSNTYMLEKTFKWNGILCEPSRTYQNEIVKIRDCFIDNRCVWKVSNMEMEFVDCGKTGLSTLSEYALVGIHKEARLKIEVDKYKVNSVTLNDLLEQHNAPKGIDYISIDTEGCELEILKVFDFIKWDVKIFTIEHNFDAFLRKNIYDLMDINGYVRIYEQISYQDDWYVKI